MYTFVHPVGMVLTIRIGAGTSAHTVYDFAMRRRMGGAIYDTVWGVRTFLQEGLQSLSYICILFEKCHNAICALLLARPVPSRSGQ